MSLQKRWRLWFIRRQGPETGPIELHRRQIYILPSGTGLLFAVVLLTMYLGAVNYNLGLGHALVFLLVGLGIVGMLHAFRNLVGLRIRAGRTSPVFAGETASFELILENTRRDARPGINLQKFGANATFCPLTTKKSPTTACGRSRTLISLLKSANLLITRASAL